MAHAGFVCSACNFAGICEILGNRLFAIDVFSSGDCRTQQLGAQLGGGSVEEQRIFAILQSAVEVRGPARNSLRLCQLRELSFIAPDEDRIRHHPIAVLERHAALRPNGDNGANEMLIHAHAAGDAVHDDAKTLLRHDCPLVW